ELRELRLSDIQQPLRHLRDFAQHCNEIRALDRAIATNAVFAAVGERVGNPATAVLRLEEAAEQLQSIRSGGLAPTIRDRLLASGNAAFRRAISAANEAVRPALASYQRDIRRLSDAITSNLTDFSEAPSEMAAALESLRPAIGSLTEWNDVARRRGHLVAAGLGPLIEAFEQASLPPSRLADTLHALLVHQRAIRIRSHRAALREANGLDLETERKRFASVDLAL